MKTLVRYSGAVLLPVTLGVLAGLWVTDAAFERLRSETDARVAASATDLILREMGDATDALLGQAEAVQPTQPYPPAVEAALRGDTVLALGSSAESLELTLVYGDGPLVRIATGPFRPTVMELLPSIAGYRLALYLRGTRTVTTEPAFSPEVLHPEVLLALARSPDGMAFGTDDVTGTLRAFQAVAGRPTEVAVFAAAGADAAIPHGSASAAVTVLIVVLLLSGFAAWITHNPRRPMAEGVGAVEHSPLQWALVVLMPVLAGAAILLSLDRDYRQSATLTMRDQLSRAAILIRQVDRTGSVSGARAATGFDVARLQNGRVEAATRDEADLIEALTGLRPPPPNFTSSGVISVDDGSRFYSAVRTSDGATLILISTSTDEEFRSVRRRMGLAGLLILLPPLLFLWLVDHPETGARSGRGEGTEA